MNPLDYIYQKLQEVITYLNLMRENSKRIDELPNATTGTKLVAVWNEQSQQTEKAYSTSLFNQNNVISYNKFDIIEGNGLLTTTQLAEYLNSINHTKIVSEVSTPVIYEALKANVDKIYKYIFFLRMGKGTYTNFDGSNFVLISTTQITPADIEPSPDVNIYNLGEIPSLSDFISAANASDTYIFTDTNKTNYFTYSVIYNEGTPQEYEVLYLSQFVGSPGTYGLEGEKQFVQSDFVDTSNSAPDDNRIEIVNKPYYYKSWYTGLRIPVSIENGKAKYNYDVSKLFNLYNYTPYFVSPTGNDSNDGLTEETAKSSVLNTFNSGGRLIYMMPGNYLRDKFVGNNFTIGNSDLLIIGIGEVNITTAQGNLNWVLSTNNTYRAGRTQVTEVYDFKFLNKYGYKTNLKKVATQALCEAESGTYFTDNSGVWVHTSDNRVPDSSILPNVNLSNTIIGNQGRLYIENVNMYGIELFINGTDINSTIEVYMKNVKVPSVQKSPINLTQEFNCFRVNNFKTAIFQNCIGIESTQDIFNYHNTALIPNSIAAELDCSAYNAGMFSPALNNQCSSIHEGIKILRLNGNYYGGNTQVIADVAAGSQSVMIGCELNSGNEQPNTVIFYGVDADLEGCKLVGNKDITAENTSVNGVNISNSILQYRKTIGKVNINK